MPFKAWRFLVRFLYLAFVYGDCTALYLRQNSSSLFNVRVDNAVSELTEVSLAIQNATGQFNMRGDTFSGSVSEISPHLSLLCKIFYVFRHLHKYPDIFRDI